MNKIKKLIEYGLYLLVFLLPWQTRLILRSGELNGGYFEYGTISIYAVDLLLLLLFFLFGLWKIWQIKEKKEGFKIDKIWYTLATLELIIITSIFVASDKWIAFYGYLRFIFGIALFLLVTEASFEKIKLYYSFLLGVFVQSCFAIWQFVYQKTFSFKWLGLSEHDPMMLGTSVVETISGERWLRAYGGFDHPNILGGYLSIGIILLIILIMERQKEKIKYTSLVNYIFLVTFFLALFFTFSRGAWLGLLMGLFSLLILLIIKKDYSSQKLLLKIALLFGVVLFLLSIQYSSLVLTRMSGDTRLEQKSSVERIESFSVAKKIISNNLLLGTGVGNYTQAVHEELHPDRSSWFYQPVHNLYLLIFAEIGVLGALCISFYIYQILNKIYQKREDKKVLFVTFLVIIAVLSLVDHWLWSLHFGSLFIWLIMGIIYRKIHE